jgi:NO-binding membrane sensor protein with MHYT domain
MSTDFGTALVVFRSLALLVIAFTLCKYRDPTARHRPVISLIAVLAAGSSLGWAVHSLVMLPQHLGHNPRVEFWPTLFVLWTLGPVIYSRGNIAKLMPRTKWLY